MITVEQAKKLIRENITTLPSIQVSLAEAAGFTLSEDIFAPQNLPAFEQSSMDGYAFRYDDLGQGLYVSGVIPAGEVFEGTLDTLQAIRIFTGAPIPKGGDTVVMQEKVTIVDNALIITDPNVKKGDNVRAIGSDIIKGTLAIQKGTYLTPGAIGFLANMGIASVPVYKKPSILIILTGNELSTVGTLLPEGNIYESNSHIIRAALAQNGFRNVAISYVKDNLKETAEILTSSLSQYDLILFTGGISVGDYDFVLEACNINQVQTIFHKIKQKPGKPLYVGKKGSTIVCGLPGNPASVLSCFYNYITIILDQLSKTQTTLKIAHATLLHEYKKPSGLTHFLKGLYHTDTNEVLVLEGQESFKLRSFAIANCLVEIPECVTHLNANEKVLVHLF